ncbi:MAG: RibD family protein [Pseudonocardiales bacterium]
MVAPRGSSVLRADQAGQLLGECRSGRGVRGPTHRAGDLRLPVRAPAGAHPGKGRPLARPVPGPGQPSGVRRGAVSRPEQARQVRARPAHTAAVSLVPAIRATTRAVGTTDVQIIREMTQSFRKLDNRFGGGHVRSAVINAPSSIVKVLSRRLDAVATVVDGGDPLDLRAVLADLADRKVERLMVEGGATVHTRFLTAGVVDEIHLVIAPFFIGDPSAPRFVGAGTFPQCPANRMVLAETRQLGDVVLLRYLLHQRRSQSID